MVISSKINYSESNLNKIFVLFAFELILNIHFY